MTDTVNFQVTRRGTRYGVHVDNMTKPEAREMLATVADVKHNRDKCTTLELEDILNAVENPTSLDPTPAGERWATRILFGLIVFGFIAYTFHDILRDLFK